MTEDNFDRIAHEYDESLPAHVVEHYLAKRVRYIGEHCPSGRVLDVGCGTGVLAGRLARAGYAVTGLDPSQGMLDVMAETEPTVEGIRGEGSELPFEDGHFDVVITVAVLHHVADPEAVRSTLIEMVRVTRPAGRIVVWDHNPRNPYWKNLMARVPQDDGSERLVPEDEIVGGLTEGGSRDPRLEPAGPRPRLRAAVAPRRGASGRTRRRARAGPTAALRPQRHPRRSPLTSARPVVAPGQPCDRRPRARGCAGPMEGAEVVELGMWVAGLAAVGALGDWGADVVKIEPPRVIRSWVAVGLG